MSAGLQHLIWFAGQPETWFALARYAATLVLVGLLIHALWRRQNWAPLGLFVIAVVAMVGGYLWAFGLVRQGFITGLADTEMGRAAMYYLSSIHLLQTGALVLLVGLGGWSLFRRTRQAAA